GGARNAGGSGDTAQPENRHPLDSGGQTQQVYEFGVDRRACDSRHRDKDERVELAWNNARAGHSAAQGRLPQLLCNLNPDRVSFPPRIDALISLEWQYQVAEINPGATVQAIDSL